MFKYFFYSFIVIFFFNTFSISAEWNDTNTNNVSIKKYDEHNIDPISRSLDTFSLAKKRMKKADKFYDKGKKEKAKKHYQKAIEYLLKANKELPLNENILHYLAYSHERTGFKDEAEIYYNLALEVNPDNNLINHSLGIFYVQTSKLEKANKTLNTMKNCNCEEFQSLKNYIEKNT